MRSYTALSLTFAFSATIAACGATASPTVAGLGGDDTAAPGSSLAISPNQIQLAIGATRQLSTNAPASLQNQVQWGSLQTTIASISPSGLVTGVGAGTTTITANYASDTTHVATATAVVTGLTTP